jgi:predicted Rdx family selenoprotein
LPQTAVALENGDQGEFTVLVNGQVVARKTDDGLPSEGEILESVRWAPQAEVPAE